MVRTVLFLVIWAGGWVAADLALKALFPALATSLVFGMTEGAVIGLLAGFAVSRASRSGGEDRQQNHKNGA